VQLVTPMNERFIQILNRILVVLPWTLVTVISLPILLASEAEFEQQGEKWCTMSIDSAYYVRTFGVMFFTPLTIMALNIFFLIMFYILKRDDLSTTTSETIEEDISSLRMSTVAVWLACIVFLVSWLPSVTTTSVVIFFNKRACLLNERTFSFVTALYESTGATIPLLWLLLKEIRSSLMAWVRVVRNKVHMRNFKQMSTSMNWTSRNEQNQC